MATASSADSGGRGLQRGTNTIASSSLSTKIAMAIAAFIAAVAVLFQAWRTQAAPEISINVTSFTSEVDSDWSAVYHQPNDAPLLLGNDATADKGGFRAYSADAQSPLQEVASKVTGRTNLVTAVYDIDGQDYAVTIAQPTSLLRVFELPSFNEVPSATHKQLGDWSAICPWKSRSGNQYIYLFGKNQAVQYLLRQDGNGHVAFTEVGLYGMCKNDLITCC